ncbi:MAG: hypothetical protein LQ346_005785 [Caloplaca aetnensis]|nr:MAG: hypothetical protein LQ346_005785 [Caloplaca aetnensis]
MTDPEDTSVLAGPSNTLSSHPTEDAAPAMGIVAARFITSINQQLHDFLGEDPNDEDTEAAVRVALGVSRNLLDRYKRMGDEKRMGGPSEDTVMDDVPAHRANGNNEEGPREVENGAADEEDDDDVDFTNILTEATLNRVYDQPYDSRWLAVHGVPDTRLQEFAEKYMCSHKLETMLFVGAIAVGDEFAVQMRDTLGAVQWRFARVTQAGIKTEGQTHSKWWPHVALLQAKGGQPVTQPTAYATPALIIKAFEDFHQAIALSKGYGGLRVWRGAHDLGTISDIRITWALWQKILDHWTEANGRAWRKRHIDPKTGTYYQESAVKRKNVGRARAVG